MVAEKPVASIVLCVAGGLIMIIWGIFTAALGLTANNLIALHYANNTANANNVSGSAAAFGVVSLGQKSSITHSEKVMECCYAVYRGVDPVGPLLPYLPPNHSFVDRKTAL